MGDLNSILFGYTQNDQGTSDIKCTIDSFDNQSLILKGSVEQNAIHYRNIVSCQWYRDTEKIILGGTNQNCGYINVSQSGNYYLVLMDDQGNAIVSNYVSISNISQEGTGTNEENNATNSLKSITLKACGTEPINQFIQSEGTNSSTQNCVLISQGGTPVIPSLNSNTAALWYDMLTILETQDYSSNSGNLERNGGLSCLYYYGDIIVSDPIDLTASNNDLFIGTQTGHININAPLTARNIYIFAPQGKITLSSSLVATEAIIFICTQQVEQGSIELNASTVLATCGTSHTCTSGNPVNASDITISLQDIVEFGYLPHCITRTQDDSGFKIVSTTSQNLIITNGSSLGQNNGTKSQPLLTQSIEIVAQSDVTLPNGIVAGGDSQCDIKIFSSGNIICQQSGINSNPGIVTYNTSGSSGNICLIAGQDIIINVQSLTNNLKNTGVVSYSTVQDSGSIYMFAGGQINVTSNSTLEPNGATGIISCAQNGVSGGICTIAIEAITLTSGNADQGCSGIASQGDIKSGAISILTLGDFSLENAGTSYITGIVSFGIQSNSILVRANNSISLNCGLSTTAASGICSLAKENLIYENFGTWYRGTFEIDQFFLYLIALNVLPAQAIGADLLPTDPPIILGNDVVIASDGPITISNLIRGGNVLFFSQNTYNLSIDAGTVYQLNSSLPQQLDTLGTQTEFTVPLEAYEKIIVPQGTRCLLCSGATGSYVYQWTKEGTQPLGNAMVQNFLINDAQLQDSGLYTVTITDNNGNSISKTINIQVENVFKINLLANLTQLYANITSDITATILWNDLVIYISQINDTNKSPYTTLNVVDNQWQFTFSTPDADMNFEVVAYDKISQTQSNPIDISLTVIKSYINVTSSWEDDALNQFDTLLKAFSITNTGFQYEILEASKQEGCLSGCTWNMKCLFIFNENSITNIKSNFLQYLQQQTQPITLLESLASYENTIVYYDGINGVSCVIDENVMDYLVSNNRIYVQLSNTQMGIYILPNGTSPLCIPINIINTTQNIVEFNVVNNALFITLSPSGSLTLDQNGNPFEITFSYDSYPLTYGFYTQVTKIIDENGVVSFFSGNTYPIYANVLQEIVLTNTTFKFVVSNNKKYIYKISNANQDIIEVIIADPNTQLYYENNLFYLVNTSTGSISIFQTSDNSYQTTTLTNVIQTGSPIVTFSVQNGMISIQNKGSNRIRTLNTDGNLVIQCKGNSPTRS